MLYLSEYTDGSVYYRIKNLTRILHLVSIIVMLLLFLARNNILLKHIHFSALEKDGGTRSYGTKSLVQEEGLSPRSGF
jgi:hypothetical protein